MLIKLDKLMGELKNLGYDPVNISLPHVDALKIKINIAAREEQAELLFTLLPPLAASDLHQREIKANLLNILYFFPEKLSSEAVKEAKLLVNRINGAALLPGFGVDDVNQKIFYRYTLPLLALSHNIQLMKAAIDLSIDVIDIYSEMFIQIANGASYQEIIGDALITYSANLKK